MTSVGLILFLTVIFFVVRSHKRVSEYTERLKINSGTLLRTTPSECLAVRGEVSIKASPGGLRALLLLETASRRRPQVSGPGPLGGQLAIDLHDVPRRVVVPMPILLVRTLMEVAAENAVD